MSASRTRADRATVPTAPRPFREHPGALRRGSFTERIVAELAPHVPPLACCRAALIEGMGLAGGGGAPVTTRLVSARAALAALHADLIPASVERLATSRRHRYRVAIPKPASGDLEPPRASDNLCCVRSRLRGVFLACGSLSRGDAPPQLELLVGSEATAERVVADLGRLGIPGTPLARRGRPLVAVRSATGVATLLSSIGAHQGRLAFEDGRVVREVRSGVNRRLNAETANLRRTISAALSQLEAIDRIEHDPSRWQALPPALREAAVLRRRRPDDSLDALATRAGCSRPAMAGRLHRLIALGAVTGEG
jgi:hypothetical protein